MRSHPRSIQVTAALLAALLALTPVGTALASCAGMDLGASAPSAAAGVAVAQALMHHDCSHGSVRADDKTGVRSGEVRLPERTETASHAGIDDRSTTQAVRPPTPPLHLRPQPPDRSPAAAASARRTVVLLV